MLTVRTVGVSIFGPRAYHVEGFSPRYHFNAGGCLAEAVYSCNPNPS
jgi:hypothetical protein